MATLARGSPRARRGHQEFLAIALRFAYRYFALHQCVCGVQRLSSPLNQAWGRETNVLIRLAAGERVGTQLVAQQATLAARKQWLADHMQIRGSVTLDAGAVQALVVEGKSLLPVGVCGASGEFQRGELVSCLDQNNRESARGLINYNHTDTHKILRIPSHQIETCLGYIDEAELIHRDNLVLV